MQTETTLAKTLFFAGLTLLLTAPSSVFGQFGTPPSPGSSNNLQGLILNLDSLVRSAVPVVAGTALLVFLWGVAKYIFKASDEAAKEEGKRIMIWGIIALFVMFSVWGIIAFIANSLGIDQGDALPAPQLPN